MPRIAVVILGWNSAGRRVEPGELRALMTSGSTVLGGVLRRMRMR